MEGQGSGSAEALSRMDWGRVKQVLAEATARRIAAERKSYLEEVCRGDDSLRAQVEKLLRAHDSAGSFLEQPLMPAAHEVLAEKAGDRIGPYALVELIGEGGCGAVYLAEQEYPIHRRVAVKVIKLGMDTRAVIARFEAERQALALMDHPSIARVLDAGATSAGRPYFVMELVPGIKITDYCDQNHLPTEARLSLFVQVCHALQHAHQKGIIHRDVKPSNILVSLQDGVPVPKVIDFGIAKAVGQRLTEKTLFTACENFIGTPAYMSPEQAQMSVHDVDTRSDIYALGVLLYELLTGRTPFGQEELATVGLDEMRRILREQQPKRPSTRLDMLAKAEQTTVARCRQAEPSQLLHLLRGDLDWIVMRCLEKDRTRRYDTANSLAEDVTRHLNDEPVTARPPSRWYWFQKLAQRNKGPFAAAALVTLALVLGLGFSVWMLARERAARQQALRAEQKAQAESAKSQQVARFMKDMLQGVGPSAALGRDTTMLREILDKTAERVGTDLKRQPEVEAELRTTLGEVYQALGQYDQAESMYRTALTLRRSVFGNMQTNVADSLDNLGYELLSCRGETVESVTLLEEALAIRTNLLGSEHVQVASSLHHLGKLQSSLKMMEATELLQRSLALRRRLLGNDHIEVAESLTDLANSMTWQARLDEAEAYAREALDILSRLVPNERASLTVALAQSAQGGVLFWQARYQEALELQRGALDTVRKLVGQAHPLYANSLCNVGDALLALNHLREAETVFCEALAVNQKTVGEQHSDTQFCHEQLAEIYERTGRFTEAETAYRNLHPQGVHYKLVRILRRQGKHAEADAALENAVSEIMRVLEAARKQSRKEPALEALLWLIDARWRQGQVSQAGFALKEVLDLVGRSTATEPMPDHISFTALKHAALQVLYGLDAEHATLSRQMTDWAGRQPRYGQKGRAARMLNLRPVDDPQLQAAALTLARSALAGSPTNALHLWYQLNLGLAEFRSGQYAAAERTLLRSEQDGPDRWRTSARVCTSKFYRAMILARQGNEAGARQLFAEAEAAMDPMPPVVHHALALGADCDELMLWVAYKEAKDVLNAPSQ